MTDHQVWLLKIGVAVFLMSLASITVLVVGVKVGEYLEAKREIMAVLERARQADIAYEEGVAKRQHEITQKLLDALDAEMFENDFEKWEKFYDELGRNRL